MLLISWSSNWLVSLHLAGRILAARLAVQVQLAGGWAGLQELQQSVLLLPRLAGAGRCCERGIPVKYKFLNNRLSWH